MKDAQSLRKESTLFRLDGRVALVTGATGVLGGELCRGLGEAGARVLVASRTTGRAEHVAAKLRETGVEARAATLDVRDVTSVERCAEDLPVDWIPDLLVNSAGGNDSMATTQPGACTVFDLDIDAMRGVVDLNLFGGAVIPSIVFGRAMARLGKQGSIINIASTSAVRPLTRVGGYSAAKAAVASFTQWLAVHLAGELKLPIRVNALVPGFFLTDQNRFLLLNEEGKLTARGERIIDHTPMGRFGNPRDLVGPCLLLASDASSFMTGSTIFVDGGFNAWSGV